MAALPEVQPPQNIVPDLAAEENAVLMLLATDPEYAAERGKILIAELLGSGRTQEAVTFALLGHEGVRTAWLTAAFAGWAVAAPRAAVEGARQLENVAARGEASQAASESWAAIDPAGLAEYAVSLPSASTRAALMKTALSQWAWNDPAAAADWISQFETAPEFDAGKAIIAAQGLGADHHWAVAVGWARSITDPDLRAATLADLSRRTGCADR